MTRGRISPDTAAVVARMLPETERAEYLAAHSPPSGAAVLRPHATLERRAPCLRTLGRSTQRSTRTLAWGRDWLTGMQPPQQPQQGAS